MVNVWLLNGNGYSLVFTVAVVGECSLNNIHIVGECLLHIDGECFLYIMDALFFCYWCMVLVLVHCCFMRGTIAATSFWC